MSPLSYVLTFMTIVFAILCVFLRSKNRSFEGMLCKFMASFGFISLSIVCYVANPENTYYFCMICFALFLGFFGDVLLGIKEIAPTFKGKLVPLGLFYFLIGHIFYICAFTSETGFNIIALIIGIAGGAFAFVMIKVLKMKVVAPLRIAMTVYYAALVYKVAISAQMYISDGSVMSLLALLSSLFFLFSDSILSFVYFTPVKRKNLLVTIELSSYYLAQILAASTLALV